MAFTQRKLTRLKVWDRYNGILKKYSKKPLIRNIDIEAIKSEFEAKSGAADSKPSKKSVSLTAESTDSLAE